MKPRLSRKLVKSAKINLNKYWNKFEELITPEIPSKKLISSNTIPNNKIHPASIELNEFLTKKFIPEKNFARTKTSKYKHFQDDSLYHGVNLNLVPQQSNQQQQHQTEDCLCNLQFRFYTRNFQITPEDVQNLENEAMEVIDYGYLF